MGPIVIYYHVNIMESNFELARQGLNEFVHPGHKGLIFITLVCVFEHFLSHRDIAKYMGSFLDAEFKNDVRFS